MRTSKSSSEILTVTPAVMEIAAIFGFPLPVRHADKVCTAESKTAPNDMMRMSRTSQAPSSPVTAPKRNAAVCDGKANRNAAAGRETKKVHFSAKQIFFSASDISPFA